MSLWSWASARRRGAIFFGWWVVTGGFILQALSGGLVFQAFGAYFVHLQAEFGWSRTVLAGSYSLMRVESGFLGPAQGWLIERLGAQAVLRAGLVFLAAGFVFLSFVHSTFAFYAAFLIIAIGSSLAGWITINVALVNWFRRRRGMALGLVSAGHAMGGLLVPIVAWALSAYGWRATAFASGMLVLLAGLPITLVMRNTPEQYGLAPDGAAPGTASSTGTSNAQDARLKPGAHLSEVDYTAREALRSSAFWLIGLGHAFAVLVVSAVSVHLIPHLVERLGMSVTMAGTMLAVMTILTLVGHVAGGLVADRADKRQLAILSMVGHALGMLALAFASSWTWVVAFAVLHGLAWGVRGPLMSAIRADYFGRKAFGTILGFSSLVVMFGSIAGPLLAGFLADRTGDYRLGFILLAVLAGVGTVFFILVRKPAPPRRQAAARSAGGPGR